MVLDEKSAKKLHKEFQDVTILEGKNAFKPCSYEGCTDLIHPENMPQHIQAKHILVEKPNALGMAAV